MKCPLCKKSWPGRLVSTLFTSSGNIDVDPICALKELREIHGDSTLEFSGEMNKKNYAEAIQLEAHRKEGV